MKQSPLMVAFTLLLTLVFFYAGNSFAAFTTYTNQAAWEAAVTNAIVNEDFNSSTVEYWADPINQTSPVLRLRVPPKETISESKPGQVRPI